MSPVSLVCACYSVGMPVTGAHLACFTRPAAALSLWHYVVRSRGNRPQAPAFLAIGALFVTHWRLVAFSDAEGGGRAGARPCPSSERSTERLRGAAACAPTTLGVLLGPA